MDKTIVGDSDVRNQVFSHLNLVQISYILKYFEPDEFSPEPIPDRVKRTIEDAVRRENAESLSMQLDPLHIEYVNLCMDLL
jgi:hypothetical protein